MNDAFEKEGVPLIYSKKELSCDPSWKCVMLPYISGTSLMQLMKEKWKDMLDL